MKIVKCGKCGWYHMEQDRADVIKSATDFVEYFNRLSPKDREDFYSRSEYTVEENVSRHERCFSCGASYKDFVDDDDKCPNGVTIQGIINRKQ